MLETTSQSIVEEDNDDNDDNNDDGDTRVSLPGVPVSSSTNIDVSLSFRSTVDVELIRRLRQR
jgi:hypothetical protein